VNSIAAHFESLGMTSADAASRAALFAELEKRSAPILEGAPQWRRFTPGRIEIFGKHTDYAGGHSLLATVPRGITLAARKRADGIVRVGDIFDGQLIEVDPSKPAPPHYRGLQRYVHVVAHRFFLNFPGCELGANIAIASDLPRASGMSSSSALVVGVALALMERGRLRDRDEWQRHLRRVHDLAWYLGCVENGLGFPGLLDPPLHLSHLQLHGEPNTSRLMRERVRRTSPYLATGKMTLAYVLETFGGQDSIGPLQKTVRIRGAHPLFDLGSPRPLSIQSAAGSPSATRVAARPGDADCGSPDLEVRLPTGTNGLPDLKVRSPTGTNGSPESKVGPPTGTSRSPESKVGPPAGTSLPPGGTSGPPGRTESSPEPADGPPAPARDPFGLEELPPGRTDGSSRFPFYPPPRRMSLALSL